MSEDRYDAIIIGAGISGLVCGCYLANAGMKVLIAEQHNKPGGYCTSFKRNGFTFDAAAHSFGSYREAGNMRRMFKELNLDRFLKIKRYDPSDIIISPDHEITFWADINKTVRGLQAIFPQEANGIKAFFYFLIHSKPFELAILRNKTFKDLLNQYFIDEKLKSMLSLPILGNGGLPPSLISAFTGAKIYTEFLLDGGYYPEGGMQSLSDALAERFKELDGELRLSCLVKKIKVKNNNIKGIVVNGGFIPARFVVSNCDAKQTFCKLLGSSIINKEVLNKLKIMAPSHSVFVLYLGLADAFQQLLMPGVNTWILPHYDLEKMYYLVANKNINCSTGFMMRLSPDKKSFLAFINTPFKNEKYWRDNKKELSERFIKRIEYIVPELSKHIVYKEVATPSTMYRYTLNFRGAAYGWASIPSQLFTPELKQATAINGLYLSGHWTTRTQGVAGVAYMGRETGKLILKKERYKNLHTALS